MAEDDIYGSKHCWETILKKIESGAYLKPHANSKFYIKNRDNLKYFPIVAKELDLKDNAFIRRQMIVTTLKKICYLTEKDLKDITQEDVKEIVRKANSMNKTSNSRNEFLTIARMIWKMILPEKDHLGRVDTSIVPYSWRIKVDYSDKSIKKDKSDKITYAEYTEILKGLNGNPKMQLFISLMFSNLARPQEICFIDLEDVTIFDNYARIRISKHGKEGTKTLQLIDNFYYLIQWLNVHPYWRKDNKMPLFITTANNSRHKRMNPIHANKALRNILEKLNIKKPLSGYSFKRNGVTSKLIAGENPQDIQKTAGWASFKTIQSYDLSVQEDYFKEELIRKGVIKTDDKDKKINVHFKVCAFCNDISPLTSEFCMQCKRPLNREEILKVEQDKDKTISDLTQKIDAVYAFIEQSGLSKEVLQKARMKKLGRTMKNANK